ncbi:25.3 kDa vesicle transport protein [Acorus calamus]|uniref:25.3 kDa vesicle transport protein n=1 Tax=Acorus calamus TaxID=4465 RepID=A0AAV9CMX7_ACOCL|nr:25.3 kDa vesicle transport protein [Acorus calamus]
MVKLTFVGRLSDGLPLAQGIRYLNEEDENSSICRQKGELILKQISLGALTHPKMSILIDHHCFQSYPRKLAFYYLKDLQKEFQKIDIKLIEKVSRPYAFIGFDHVIGNIRRQYLDIRTQANLSKLNSGDNQICDIITDDFSNVINNEKKPENYRRASETPHMIPALKWTPTKILTIITAVVLWLSITITYKMAR